MSLGQTLNFVVNVRVLAAGPAQRKKMASIQTYYGLGWRSFHDYMFSQFNDRGQGGEVMMNEERLLTTLKDPVRPQHTGLASAGYNK